MLSAAVHVTGIQRGTGEEVECRTNASATCSGINPSGKRLIDRVVSTAQTFAHAARRLTGSDPPGRAPDGTLQVGDLTAVGAAVRKLPVQLALTTGADDRTILWVFLRDNPAVAVTLVANDPFGFMDLLDDIRRGRYGAGDLIDAPFPTGAVVGTLVAVGVIGSAAWLARR